ncbi:MAG: 50S ribosomal protein L9 [Candidatus Andersenbacteria bacterium]
MAKRIQVILLEDINSIGRAGDIVAVSEGYARNFLFVQGKAALATSKVVAEKKRHRATALKQQEAELQQLQEQAQQLDGTELVIPVRVKDGEQIFGSITAKKIAEELRQQAGLTITPKDVKLAHPITSISSQAVTVRLAPTVETSIQVTVTAEPHLGRKPAAA